MTVDINSRYGLNLTHSEVVEACQVIEPCYTFMLARKLNRWATEGLICLQVKKKS